MSGAKINSDELNNLLTLLAFVVLCDGKILPEEVAVFSKQSNLLAKRFSPNILFSEEMGESWFKSNLYTLKNLLSSDDRHVHIAKAVQKFSNFKHNIEIYYSMKRIALSDGEFHENERDVIEIASKLWNLAK